MLFKINFNDSPIFINQSWSNRFGTWQSLNKMSNVWKSDLSNKRKLNLFRATSESILLYGCQTWTITKSEEARLDGCYTRMLRTVKNISWKSKLSNVCHCMGTSIESAALSEVGD